MSLSEYASAPYSLVRHIQCLMEGEADKEKREHDREMRNSKRGRRGRR